MNEPIPIPPLDPSRILYEDYHLIVINKPAPLLTQAPAFIPSLEAMVKQYIKDRYSKPAGVYLGIPHRLDRPVSGVVCFAKNTKAAQRIHAQFEDRSVEKTYWAIVHGTVSPPTGEWEDYLKKIPEESRMVRSDASDPQAKLASLSYTVRAVLPGGDSWIALSPKTGRMHQLRVQSALRGHPVLGDVEYGSSVKFGPEAELPREQVVALHGRSLALNHPTTKQRMTFEAPVPSYWPTLPE